MSLGRIIFLFFLLVPMVAHSKCPEGIFSDPSENPFYEFKVDSKNSKLIFCGYAGEDEGSTILSGEYDIFLIGPHGHLLNEGHPILSFGAVAETIIYKSPDRLAIKDIWGGFTYTFNSEDQVFRKTYSYKPADISRGEFNHLKDSIESGQIDYMWPWKVLDAAILGYPGAENLFLGLSKYISNSAAGSEEYSKTKLVYDAYKQNVGK